MLFRSYGKADITCDGPVTIHGEKDGGSVLANAGNFTYHRTDGACLLYTSRGLDDASLLDKEKHKALYYNKAIRT